jgi:uncharacterized membrane protein
MENLMSYLKWDALHLDAVVMLLVICAGFFQKKYLANVNLLPALKTLIVGCVFVSIWVLIKWVNKSLERDKVEDYFISFAVATSLYDLVLKPILNRLFPKENES